MSENLTPDQALLLFGLLAFHGECAQAELMPAVKKADREALEKAKLIGVKKVGRAFFFTLSDAGWDWAGANLSAELPSAHRTLHEMLGRLDDHLVRENRTLADFIGAKPEREVDTKPKSSMRKTETIWVTPDKLKKPKASTKPKSTTVATKALARAAKPKVPSPAALRKRIETAYLSLTGGSKNESVRLARLRGEMPDLDRATVDAALARILKGDKKASLMRHDDPNQLDSADHAAAFNPAGEPFHVIWIAS